MKLTIRGKGLVAKGFQVLLDDLDVSRDVTEVKLALNVGDVNRAKVTFMPSEVEVDAEALAALTAHLEAQGAANV